jgi:PAS domain S-box-containing protein
MPYLSHFRKQFSITQQRTAVGSAVGLFLTVLAVLFRLHSGIAGAWGAKSRDFMTYGYGYMWNAPIVWLHVLADGLIALAYFCIPLTLIYLARRRRDFPFNWLLWTFGLFFVGCGTTHVLGIWTVWPAWHLFAGVVKATTAVLSVATVAMLIPLLPKAIALPSESEELLQSMMNGIPQLAWMANADGHIFWYNQRWYEYTGTTFEQMEGWGWQTVHDPAMLPKVLDRWKAAIGLGTPFNMEFPLRRVDGHFGMFLTQVIPARNSEGRVVRWFGTNTDVTELRRAEEVRERLAAAVESSDDAIICKSLDGTITSWNRGAAKIFGYSAAEAMGRSMLTLIPDERAREESEIMARIGRGETVDHFETLRVRKDRKLIHVSVTISPIRDSSGTIVGASKVARDITERRLAEIALKQSLAAREDALKELFDQKFALDQHAIVAVTDVQGTISYVNDKFCSLSQYSKEELIGQNHRILNSGHHPKEFFQEMYRIIASGKVWHGEIKNRSKDGSAYWVDATVVPVLTAEGKPRQYVAIRTDITERKRAEERLEAQAAELQKTRDELEIRVKERTVDLANANKVLERSNVELQQFAYISSHDLQEPLRMIASYTQLLARRYKGRLDSDADEFITFIVDGCNRMQGLIQDLLIYSRAGTNGKEPCEAAGEDALQGALTNLRMTIEQSGAVVTHDPLPAITTDETQLTQVFQNLVGNAIKYRSTAAPRVHISATKNGSNEWIFSVRDNGMGIAPQYFERIFVLFQRLHGREEFEGTGIGLAICKKIVEHMGGRIWVESQLEKGSTFFFALPVRDDN